MEFTATFIDHDLAVGESQRLAGRQATAAALARCKQKFGAFLTGDDLPARFDLIESDLRQTISAVVEEYGGDFDNILSSVTTVLSKGGFCDDCKAWKSGPRAGCTCSGDTADEAPEDDDAQKTSSDHWIQKAVKKPGELHRDLGVPQGEKIPEDKLEEAEHSKNKKVRERAQFAENVKKGGGPGEGAFDPTGELGPYEPDMPSRLDPTKLPVGEIAGHDDTGYPHGPQGSCPNCNGPADGPPCPHCGYDDRAGSENAGDPSQTYGGGHAMDDPEMPGNVPDGPLGGYEGSWKGDWRVAAEAPKGDLGAIERESVDVGSGPEPKMDKKEWKPNALNEEGNLKPIDTEMSGTRHPTVHQDISQVPDHTKDFREQTEAGETHETLKSTDSFDGSGFNKEKNITQYPTRTFGDKGQQPSGVGRDAFPKASGHEAAVTELDQYINANTLEDMRQWLNSKGDASMLSPHDVLTQVNQTYPHGVRGFISDNDPNYRNTNGGARVFASESCPSCGANPESETRCSVCKGWDEPREASIQDPDKNPIESLIEDSLLSM